MDVENRLLWHANRRRLDWEAMRDSFLAASGNLDPVIGGRAVPFTAPRRTIYGYVDRLNIPGMLRAFDFASVDAHSPQRHQTTVPQQALFLLNSPFVQEQARSLLKRAELTGVPDAAAKIQRVYRLIYARAAHADEVSLGETFVQSANTALGTTALTPWERYAQVLLLANEFMFVD